MTPDSFTLDVRLEERELEEMLRRDVGWGLSRTPKELPPKWFYDERGCALFDEITRLPEYYLTRRETEILHARGEAIAAIARAQMLIELGSGNSEKTQILLDALTSTGSLEQYVSLDIAESYLRTAAEMVAARYPIKIHGVVGDFERHADDLPRGFGRLIVFLGSTIGNLYPTARARFFRTIAHQMLPGDAFLLGADLVKSVARLEAAYNDSVGVSSAFNRNVLRVLNRRLGANFDLGKFQHHAFFDSANSWIEMRLRSTRFQQVTIPELDLQVSFEKDEEMRTEISAKFTRNMLIGELGNAGLKLSRWWTDGGGDYSLSLWSPT